ncbi:CLASP family protein [Sporobolomyces koalae]|uniref:CLASP family protein n=1 Tax=Sporobolomyces koalae TaxID=500713 RepID=UPI0031750E3E
MEWLDLEPLLAHADTDKRIQALDQLHELLAAEVQAPPAVALPDPEHLATTLRTLLKSNNAHVANAALPVVPLYFERLAPHVSPATLKHALTALVPTLVDKLGDAKLAPRELARAGIVAAARLNLHLGIQTTSAGKLTSDRTRNFTADSLIGPQAALALLEIRTPPETTEADGAYPIPPLKPFTPLLLPLLSDSDATVRATALSTTIAIFSSPAVSPAAKTDLKKLMSKLDVTKKVQDQILASVLAGHEQSTSRASSSAGDAAPVVPSGPATRTRTRAQAAAGSSTASSATSTPASSKLVTPLPSAAFPTDPATVHTAATIEPVYLASPEDLRSQFDAIKPWFDGKETEHNWIERDKSIAKLRGMVQAGVCHDDNLRDEFVKRIKDLQDGILKTSSSLRTTLACSTLTLLATLATSLPIPLVDSLLDPFLTHCLSMSTQTKKIVATASQETVVAFIEHSSYHLKTVQLVSNAMNDKVVQSRQFMSSHLTTFLRHHQRQPGTQSRAKFKQLMDSTGGTDEIESSIKKGLADPNATVRENCRTAFWEFANGWPERANDDEGLIRKGLDSQAKKLLDKAKPRPDDAPEPSVVADTTSTATSRRSVVEGSAASGGGKGSAKKPSVREMMLAAKKKKLAEEAAQAQAEAEAAAPQEPVANQSPSPKTRVEEPRDLNRTAVENRSNSSHSSTRVEEEEHAREHESLQDVESPFAARTRATSRTSPALDTPTRTAALSTKSRRTPVQVPQVEPVVDESLKEQALQAEQTAERLLEIAQEEQEDESPAGPALTPLKPRMNNRSISQVDGDRNGTMQTPVQPQGTKLLFGKRRNGANDIFQDSPDPRDATGGGQGTWWMNKTLNVGSVAPLPEDSVERTTEIEALISSFENLELEPLEFKRISVLSRERPVRDTPELDADDTETGQWWRQARRFERVYTALRRQLLQSTEPAVREQALVVLRDLVENQSACFAGIESQVFELLFTVRQDPSRTSIAASEAIAIAFTNRLDPVYGVGTLCPALESYLKSTSEAASDTAVTTTTTRSSYALGLKLLGSLFESLPVEILEDVFPQTQSLIKSALNDQTSGDLRRAAINALVSAQSVLRDESKLTNMMQGFEPDQANLLSYYCAKKGF